MPGVSWLPSASETSQVLLPAERVWAAKHGSEADMSSLAATSRDDQPSDQLTCSAT